MHAPPPAFTISTITDKFVVYVPAERADILPLFLLYTYMYSVGQSNSERRGEGRYWRVQAALYR
jgi:hypothetical protein